ncbi:hypothetical protein ACJMK2_011562 [Sinanodonta woodiana]|uniref:TIR domain-containing protein n=1 Tax=Sinanodonta woodiana TaxID=1069815 RepID=A0ABD3V5E7_SINWO
MATYSSVSLTTREENTVNKVERDSEYVLDREGHHRYLRLGRALLYLKEPLHEPVLSEIKKLHSKLKKKIHEKKSVVDKTTLKSYLNSQYFNKRGGSNKIYIKNVNIEKWEDQPWETAKAFMPSGQKESNKSPEDTDIMGILRPISSCKQFDNWLKVDGVSGHAKVEQVLEVRHSIGHSNSLCCTETEMEDGIGQIKILMEYLKQRFKDFADADDVSEDDKRIYQEAAKKMEVALDCVEKVKTGTDFDVMRKLVVKDICKSWTYESLDETQRKVITKVLLRCVTRKIFNLLNDLYKERSQVFKKHLQDKGVLESFIIEANSDVDFLVAALEEKQMFLADKLDDLLQLIKPLHKEDDFIKIKTSMMKCKTNLERTSAIALATVYDVFILYCEADREEANTFRQDWLVNLQDLDPPAKTILYDEYVLPGTSHVSALENVLEDCRLVFILCTQAILKDDLSRFQAEIVMYNSLEKKKAATPRVIAIHLRKEDFKCSPSWISGVNSFCVWNPFSQTILTKTLKTARET